jgi:hypothetical protein
MATYTVGPSGDYATMSAAIAAATAGDTLQVLAAYSFDPAAEGTDYVHINKDNLTIESATGVAADAVIECNQGAPYHVINIHTGTTGTTLSKLTLKQTYTGGTSARVINAQSLAFTLSDCVLESPQYGIDRPGTGSVISRCHFKAVGVTVASRSYAIFRPAGAVVIESCLFENWQQMAVYNAVGSQTTRNCTFYMPTSTSSGVYAMWQAGTVNTVANCVFYAASTMTQPIIMSDYASSSVKNCVAFGFANMVFTGLGGNIVQASNVGNATVVTPVFVSLGTDFHPDSSGSAYQAGDASLAAATDIDGNPFDTPPSIGCYEAVASGGGTTNSVIKSMGGGLLSSPFTLTP